MFNAQFFLPINQGSLNFGTRSKSGINSMTKTLVDLKCNRRLDIETTSRNLFQNTGQLKMKQAPFSYFQPSFNASHYDPYLKKKTLTDGTFEFFY